MGDFPVAIRFGVKCLFIERMPMAIDFVFKSVLTTIQSSVVPEVLGNVRRLSKENIEIYGTILMRILIEQAIENATKSHTL